MCLLQERQPIYCDLIAALLVDLRQVMRIECYPSLRPAFPRMVKARQQVNTRGKGSISVVPLNSLTGSEREKAMTDIAKFAAVSTSNFSFGEPEPQDAPIGSIVIHRQHTRTVQVLRRRIDIPSAVGLFFEFHREPKGRALTRLTLGRY